MLQTTVEALVTYSEKFGPYRHKTLSAVQGDFNDGMEFSALYFISRDYFNLYDNTPKNYLVIIAAHETAHQWWFDAVANDQALEPCLDEALSTYSEHIFYENLYPDSLSWWWTYRVDYYQPEGWVNTTIYNPDNVPNAYQSYRNAVYLNGAHFLHDLRHQVGDVVFFSIRKTYANRISKRNSYRITIHTGFL